MDIYTWLSSSYQWLTLLLAIVGLAFYLGKRFTTIEAEIYRVDGAVASEGASLQAAVRSMISIFMTLSASLRRMGGLSKEDEQDLSKALAGGLTAVVEAAITRGERRGNPLTHDEANRLRRYVQMAREGATFTPDEARDFYALSDRLSQEEPNEPGVWPLLALAAFLFGLYMGARK